jgi:hypothetical protein
LLKDVLEDETIEVVLIAKNRENTMLYIDGALYINPWLPPYYDQWLYDVDYDDSDEQDNLRDHFRKIYKNIVKSVTPRLQRFLRDGYGIDI